MQFATLAKTCLVAGFVVLNFLPAAASQNLPSLKACPFGEYLLQWPDIQYTEVSLNSPYFINVK